LKSTVIIFFMIVNYLFFEWQKSKLSTISLNLLSYIFNIIIICFAIIILFLGFLASGTIVRFELPSMFLLSASLHGLIVLPSAGIVVMMTGLFRR